ncbi:MAG: excinuclease ABC subunit UvrC [Clostridia bacterium]|nr:excinuclease ABC subunit UvrC [Clostridia bacterium]
MNLPLSPGVYLMKNTDGGIIYVGKAKKLKNRVSTYFGSQNNHPEKVRKMVENVNDFDYIICDSEFEALVLECSLIKQYMPKYNILLKDDRGYNYVRITKGDWPTISASFGNDDKNCEYIGPYMSSFVVRQTVDEARKIFRLPFCNKKFPEDIGKARPCLNYFIKQCSAPCAGKISQKDYYESVMQAVNFIKGGSEATLKELTEKMLDCSEKMQFEKAAYYRDRINAIKKTGDSQKVITDSKTPHDVFALTVGKTKSCVAVLRFDGGKLCDSETFLIDSPDYPEKARYEILRSFYSTGRSVPSLILLDGEAEDSGLLEQWLCEIKGKSVTITVPQRGEKLRLVEMCKNNSSEKLAQTMGRHAGEVAALEELAELIGLDKPPEFIESYDISHTAGSDNVAGMVVYKDGLPYKKSYRKFSIKGFTGQDDYASMAEVIDRRLNRYFEEKDSGEGFGRLPDLILLDGGRGQVNAVVPVIEKYSLDIPVFGMVKDGHHKTRAITTGGREISISSSRKAFTLVSQIQEEVHRFAISFHRAKHKSRSFASRLTQIEGIGEKKAALLMKNFKTIKALSEATEQEISEVKGISKKNAEDVYAFFRENDQ